MTNDHVRLRGFDRRRALKAAAWSAPAVTVIGAAPAFAAYEPVSIPGTGTSNLTSVTSYVAGNYHRWIADPPQETALGSHLPGTQGFTFAGSGSKVLTVTTTPPAGLPTNRPLTSTVRMRDASGNTTRPALFGPPGYTHNGWTFLTATFKASPTSGISPDHMVEFTFTHPATTTPIGFTAQFIGVEIRAHQSDQPGTSSIAANFVGVNFGA